MRYHYEPLGNEPGSEVRAMPPVYPQSAPTNTLFYGDNLDILREYIADASIDLVCLDLFDRAYRTRYTSSHPSALPYRCTSRSQTCPLGTNRRSSGK